MKANILLAINNSHQEMITYSKRRSAPSNCSELVTDAKVEMGVNGDQETLQLEL